jgi:hypothetical protein
MNSSFLVKMDQLAAKKAGNGITEGDAAAAVASAQVGKQKIKDLVINVPSILLLVIMPRLLSARFLAASSVASSWEAEDQRCGDYRNASYDRLLCIVHRLPVARLVGAFSACSSCLQVTTGQKNHLAMCKRTSEKHEADLHGVRSTIL